MSRLAPCPSCGRHVLVSETSCPFCAHAFDGSPQATEGSWGKTILRVGAIAAVASLSACAGVSADYGAPPEPDMEPDMMGDEDAGPEPDMEPEMMADSGVEDPGGGNADYGAPPEP